MQLIHDPRFAPMIYSSRSQQDGGIDAMRKWLVKNGLSHEQLQQLEFPIAKPPAWLTIDDRCIQFTGRPPGIEEMAAFTPWNKPKRTSDEPA